MTALGSKITDVTSWITASWRVTGNTGQEVVIRTFTVSNSWKRHLYASDFVSSDNESRWNRSQIKMYEFLNMCERKSSPSYEFNLCFLRLPTSSAIQETSRVLRKAVLSKL
jgi:hypothetical protein